MAAAPTGSPNDPSSPNAKDVAGGGASSDGNGNGEATSQKLRQLEETVRTLEHSTSVALSASASAVETAEQAATHSSSIISRQQRAQAWQRKQYGDGPLGSDDGDTTGLGLGGGIGSSKMFGGAQQAVSRLAGAK